MSDHVNHRRKNTPRREKVSLSRQKRIWKREEEKREKHSERQEGARETAEALEIFEEEK